MVDAGLLWLACSKCCQENNYCLSPFYCDSALRRILRIGSVVFNSKKSTAMRKLIIKNNSFIYFPSEFHWYSCSLRAWERTIFGNRIFEDVIKLRVDRRITLAFKFHVSILRDRKGHMRMMWTQVWRQAVLLPAKEDMSLPKLGEPQNSSSVKPPESMTLPNLDFEPLVSRSVAQSPISLSHQDYGML